MSSFKMVIGMGVFIVKFRDNPEEERLYCEAPLGEHFIRFGMNLEVDGEIWKNRI